MARRRGRGFSCFALGRRFGELLRDRGVALGLAQMFLPFFGELIVRAQASSTLKGAPTELAFEHLRQEFVHSW